MAINEFVNYTVLFVVVVNSCTACKILYTTLFSGGGEYLHSTINYTILFLVHTVVKNNYTILYFGAYSNL